MSVNQLDARASLGASLITCAQAGITHINRATGAQSPHGSVPRGLRAPPAGAVREMNAIQRPQPSRSGLDQFRKLTLHTLLALDAVESFLPQNNAKISHNRGQ